MRPYVIFASAGLSLLMYAIDGSAVAVAFPNFMKEFGTNVLWAGWTISIYLVAITSVMPLSGKLSDSFGSKKVFLSSLILFTGSSLACGFAPNIYTLIAFRFLQGVGGASFIPTATAIVSDQFPESRQSVVGLTASIFPIGGIVGPNLGGWIISRYSWRYIFYINLPIGILLIGLILLLLKDSKVLSRPHIDFVGASFFFGGILFLMIGLNLIGQKLSVGLLLLTALSWGISIGFLFLFLRHEKKDPSPILDITLLKSRPFLAANLYNTVVGVAVFGIFNIIPYYATSMLKLSTMVSGMILTPCAVGNICTAVVVSFNLRRWGYRWPMVLGLIVTSLTTFLLDQGLQLQRVIGIHFGSVETIIFILMLFGIGMGFIFPSSNNACIELMPDKVATITGLRGMFRSIGGALGISLITVILHLSSTPANGFRMVFLSFGLGLLFTIPLAFLMPTGRKGWREG
ncbi:MAG TPA: DHA2 family efflux MFS transporter permease subunit [Thermodesulfobacteriota bacterium]|nr:DHA2 family efflux MFS transporter permease subunit [Thermodesulfobacteriota bacterium]